MHLRRIMFKAASENHVGLVIQNRLDQQRYLRRIVFEIGVLDHDDVAAGFLNAPDYFDLSEESPYMLLVGPVKESHRTKPSQETTQNKQGIDLLNVARSDIPAVTHVDYSARVQTLTEERNGMFYQIVKAFDEKTGCPVIINTSFNIRGEPIVNRPEQAYRCFMLTDMDALVLQNCVLLKEGQPPMPGAEEYKRLFKLD